MKAKTYKDLAPPPFAVGDRVRPSQEAVTWFLRNPASRGTVTKCGLQTITVLIDGEQEPRAWAPDFWVREA